MAIAKNKLETGLKHFEDNLPTYQVFQTKIESLVTELMNLNTINYHHIASRTKNIDSLKNKLTSKEEYKSIEDITDIVGCRIITYFEDEVDKIASIIEKEFDVDKQNSIDKRKIEFDRFGYLSLHYVLNVNKTRCELTEYKKYEKLKFELQIRSILQHSWAEIEHDIGYKGEYSIPDLFKRRFSRIAALLETADSEFIRLREELLEYEHEVGKEIKKNPENVRLNKASLLSFINSNKNLKEVDKEIVKSINIKEITETEDYIIEELLYLLKKIEINSIKDIEDIYLSRKKDIIEFATTRRPAYSIEDNIRGVNGFSIYDMVYLLNEKINKL